MRATIRVADPGLVSCAGLSALDVPDTDATIIDELAQASDPNLIVSVLADAALLDLDRYATGRGLRYSRVGTALMLAAPSDQRLAEAIDTVAAAAIGAGARLTDVTTQYIDEETTQYIDEEKALASIGIDLWATRSSEEPTGKADRILYVGRDGARSWAMRSGVDVVCLSRRGSYQGTLIGANRGAHASRLLAQVALTGDHERRVRRCHLRRAQPTPTPRPTQRRPVLRVRHPPVRVRRRAARRRARTVLRYRARTHQ